MRRRSTCGCGGRRLSTLLERRAPQINVRVRGSLAGYAAVNHDSTRTVAVQAGPAVATPTISDTTPRVGQVLSAAPGTCKPAGVAFTYRWYRNGTFITGATRCAAMLMRVDQHS